LALKVFIGFPFLRSVLQTMPWPSQGNREFYLKSGHCVKRPSVVQTFSRTSYLKYFTFLNKELMSFWVVTNNIAAWLLPPGCLLIFAACGLLRMRKHPRSGKTLVALALMGLWLLSTPWMARTLLDFLEPAPTNLPQVPLAQAIVVLGGGKYYAAPEYGTDTVGGATLVRLRYAAHLHRLTGKPILVSGGSPEGSPVSEAQAMKTTLENDFKTPVTWAEDTSTTTLENARASFKILKAQGITRIYLVTHAWHMPRAQRVFAEAGFNVVPTPTAYTTHFQFTLLDCLPQANALQQSSWFFHEVIGIIWYRLKSVLH
jgi:uncharacterized SAM-binding protein YcdF (DUF218 family)